MNSIDCRKDHPRGKHFNCDQTLGRLALIIALLLLVGFLFSPTFKTPSLAEKHAKLAESQPNPTVSEVQPEEKEEVLKSPIVENATDASISLPEVLIATLPPSTAVQHPPIAEVSETEEPVSEAPTTVEVEPEIELPEPSVEPSSTLAQADSDIPQEALLSGWVGHPTPVSEIYVPDIREVSVSEPTVALPAAQASEELTSSLPNDNSTWICIENVVEAHGSYQIRWIYQFDLDGERVIAEGKKLEVNEEPATWGEKETVSVWSLIRNQGKATGSYEETNHVGNVMQGRVELEWEESGNRFIGHTYLGNQLLSKLEGHRAEPDSATAKVD